MIQIASICKPYTLKICSNGFLLADGTFLFTLEPLVDALRVVRVATLLQLFDIIKSLEIFEAYGALVRLRLGILLLTPDLGLDCAYLG